MPNPENLIPNEKRTPSERRKNAQKAGKASGKARKERKQLKDELLALLSDGDAQEKICIALMRQAQRGNIKAFEVLRDTIGESPKDISSDTPDATPDPLSASLEELAGEIDANK